MHISEPTLWDDQFQTAENSQLKESPAGTAMEQDSRGVETDRKSGGVETAMEIAHSKEQLLWAKEERRQINKELEEATLIRKRLERELKDADMKVQKAKKEKNGWSGNGTKGGMRV